MSIYFSEKFKYLRKTRNLTQEQIADIFHISPQAVSRWETGATYPDIEILPHLAIFFKVTVDELLGVETILGEEKAKGYISDIRNLLNTGDLDKAIELSRLAVKEYPVNNVLQYLLIQALCTACSEETPGYKENTEKYKNEVINYGERIITNYPNEWDIKILLFKQYAKWDMKAEAKEILTTLPKEVWHTQKAWAGCVLDGDEWQKNQQVRIIRFTTLLCQFINQYSTVAALEVSQKLYWLKAVMEIENLIQPVYDEGARSLIAGGDSSRHLNNAFQSINIAELYCEAGDTKNALDFVEKATNEAMYHLEVMDQTGKDGSNYYAWSTKRNLCMILCEDYLIKSQFDTIRNETRFIKCFDTLKFNSHVLKQNG